MTNQPENIQTAPQSPIPSAQTLFRVVGLRQDFDRILQATFKATSTKPTTDEGLATKYILAASTPVDVVRLVPLSGGVVQLFWIQRMNEMGVAVLPAIVRRLKSSQSIGDEGGRHMICERLIAALKRLGEPGGQPLLECFNFLDDYSQSIAAVALGALHVSAAAETIWRLYQRMQNNPRIDYLVGALWGLIDLQQPGVDEAIAKLLSASPEKSFAELYPFAALAGGKACVRPLAVRYAAASKDGERDDILMAMAAVGQRIGQDELQSELPSAVDSAEGADALAVSVARRTPQQVAQHFQMYYERPA